MRLAKWMFVWLLGVVALASGCAYQMKGTATERNEVDLKVLRFQIKETKFPFTGKEKEFAAKSGLDDGRYYAEFRKVAEELFATNGIAVTPDINAPYLLSIEPKRYKLIRQGGGYFRSLELEARLFRNGESSSMWMGTRFVDVREMTSSSFRVPMGAWILGAMNGMQADRVIRLPGPHAVSPQGNPYYTSD